MESLVGTAGLRVSGRGQPLRSWHASPCGATLSDTSVKASRAQRMDETQPHTGLRAANQVGSQASMTGGPGCRPQGIRSPNRRLQDEERHRPRYRPLSRFRDATPPDAASARPLRQPTGLCRNATRDCRTAWSRTPACPRSPVSDDDQEPTVSNCSEAVVAHSMSGSGYRPIQNTTRVQTTRTAPMPIGMLTGSASVSRSPKYITRTTFT